MDDRVLAQRIAEARRSGAALGDTPPALTLARGYAIQAIVAAALGEAAGWKIGATNAGGQRFLGVAEPICGRVLAAGLIGSSTASDLNPKRLPGEGRGPATDGSGVQTSPLDGTMTGPRPSPGRHISATAPYLIRLPGDRDAEAEPEILFRLARAPDGDPADAVGAVHLGLEVNRPSRDDAFDLGVGFIVADNAAHAALVIGPEIPLDALARPDEVRVRLLLNGEPQQEGDASAVLGHPLAALRWLASRRPLRAGDWVATGAITRSCRLAVGDEVVADFGRLGQVTVRR